MKIIFFQGLRKIKTMPTVLGTIREYVLANKDKYSTTQVRRANFARNAKRFKHKEGGIIKSTDFIKTNNPFIDKPSLDGVRELFDNYKKNK